MKKEKNSARRTSDERLDKAFNTFTELIINKVESMQDNWQKPWLTSLYKGSPCNLQGTTYNGFNTFFLSLQSEREGYEFPIFGTFQSYISLNGKDNGKEAPRISVKKGEVGFPIVFYTRIIYNKTTKERITREMFSLLSEEEQQDYKAIPVLKDYFVFNIAQTNLEEVAPQLYDELTAPFAEAAEQKKMQTTFAPLAQIIREQSWICPIKVMNSDRSYFQSDYCSTWGQIVLPLVCQFTSEEEFNSTAFHEMAHSTKLCIQRETTDDNYAREELVAELTAAIVSAKYGMYSKLADNNAAYLKSWLKHLKEEAGYLRHVMDDVKKAERIIVEHIENNINAPQVKPETANKPIQTQLTLFPEMVA